MKAKVFSAMVKGTPTQIKAYFKKNAVLRFQELDSTIKEWNVKQFRTFNSHQVPVDNEQGEYYNLQGDKLTIN